MTRMKICSPQIGISPFSNLGGAVHDREILKALAGTGNEIYIPLPSGEDFNNISNWHIYVTPHHRYYTYEYNWIFYKYVRRIWEQDHFNLLRIHSPTIAPLGWAIKRITGVHTTAHYHHLADNYIRNLISRLFIHKYDLITTDSQFSAKQIAQKFNINYEKCSIIYNGVDNKYCPQPHNINLIQKYGLESKTILLYLGVLEPRKNLPFLIRVFSNIHRLHNNTILVIAGIGSQEEYLKSYIHSLNLEGSVRLLGYVNEDIKVDIYNLANIFVSPSLMEGFGLSVAEAMACGTPVVASNNSSLPEVIGDAGLLANPQDEADFEQKIMMLLSDPELHRNLSKAGRDRIKNTFSWEKSALLAQEVYKKLAS